MKKALPIGVDNFEKIRNEGYYYVDKTMLIKELLDNWGEVNLFTRPRRFGKSLNMNMLRYFFEYGCSSELFEGLEISFRDRYLIRSESRTERSGTLPTPFRPRSCFPGHVWVWTGQMRNYK